MRPLRPQDHRNNVERIASHRIASHRNDRSHRHNNYENDYDNDYGWENDDTQRSNAASQQHIASHRIAPHRIAEQDRIEQFAWQFLPRAAEDKYITEDGRFKDSLLRVRPRTM